MEEKLQSPFPGTTLPPQDGDAAQMKSKKQNPLIWLLIIIIILIGLFIAYIFSTKQPAGQQSSKSQEAFGHPRLIGVSPVTEQTAPTLQAAHMIDMHALPLGDGNVETTPKVGFIYSCQTQFREGGAAHVGDWINGNTWDLTKKISVQGTVNWPNAQFSITTNGTSRIISGNGLPVNTTTGIFPIQSTDPAYQIDRNPNSITAQQISLTLPINPQMAQNPSCVPMGMIGVATNGVAIFNGLDASGRDAVAHEVQDSCDGHPESDGMYHYHGPSSCIPGEKEKNKLIGYAIDGYGIYSMYDATGKKYIDADLDACHGITSDVMWNGKMINIYHYVLTQEYPYTIGSFRGSSIINRQPPRGGTMNGQPRNLPPGMIGHAPPHLL